MSNQVEIITIGDELLIGQVVDTNSAWMAKELNKLGFSVFQITSVSDSEAHILDAVKTAFERVDAVLITGGLGPTKDDITLECLCKFFDTELVFDESVLQHIEEMFKHNSYVLNKLTRNQAYVPKDCTVIKNNVGTAPITWFEREGKVLVSMPGVPSEMQWVMQYEILPRLKEQFNTPTLIHKTVVVTGYPESALAIKIEDWEDSLPSHIKLAYLPAPGLVKLRLSGSSYDELTLQKEIDDKITALNALLGNGIFAEDDLPLEAVVGQMLRQKGLTMATAESCTGGSIAASVVSVPGSSEYYKGSVVAYSNEVKNAVLGVNADDLEQYGAVSQQVVEQMAQGVLKLIGVDVAVATSGVAGPTGGTEDKPVGTVWISVATKDKQLSRQFKFGNLRERNIQRTAVAAFGMLKEILLEV